MCGIFVLSANPTDLPFLGFLLKLRALHPHIAWSRDVRGTQFVCPTSSVPLTIWDMPTGLKRFQQTGHLHFVTFSCYHRLPYLAEPGAYAVFEEVLEKTRQKHDFCIAGYVLMPEHVHLLVSEPEHTVLATALKRLKWTTSRRLKGRRDHFWQARYYDFNVYTDDKHIEKLRYMHRNPVIRGLVSKPEDWPWSSFHHYNTGLPGTVEIESWYTQQARKRVTGLMPGAVGPILD